jgi:hypothetical protein
LSNTARLDVTGDELIGIVGAGTFNQSGGTHRVTGDLWLARDAGSTGVATLSGGTWSVEGKAVLGAGGNATFTQTGGTFSPARLEIGSGGGGGASFTISGGVLRATNVAVFGDGTLVLNGGTVNADLIEQNGTFRVEGPGTIKNLTIGFGSHNLIDAPLSVTGLMSNTFGVPLSGGGPLTLASGGTFRGWGTLMFPITVAGGGAIESGGGTLTISGPAFDLVGKLSNGLGTSVLVSAGSVTNRGQIVVNAGGAISFGGRLNVPSAGTVTLNGGALGANGVNVAAGGSISGFGLISSTVTNAGSITIIGPAQIVGALRNQAAGVVNVRNDQLLITGATVNNGTIRAQVGGRIAFDGGLSGNPPA